MEVSPLLAYDTAGSIKEATKLHGRAKRPNLFIKIPGTPEGLPAIEETIFKGVPVNVTLLFSREQYLAAAVKEDHPLKGIVNNTVRIAQLKLLFIAAKVAKDGNRDKVRYSIHDPRTPQMLYFLHRLDKQRAQPRPWLESGGWGQRFTLPA